MKRVAALAVTSLVMGLFLLPAPALAPPGPPPGPPPSGDGDVVSVDCAMDTIQAAVDNAVGRTTILFSGVCDDVTITKDDITLDGQDGGTVSGTITFDGAHRGVVQNATVTGPGDGIVARNGASVLIQDNTVTANGEAGDNLSSGIGVFDGASAQVLNNDITNNAFGNGVTVFSGAFAAIVGNTITGNGRPSPFFDAGIQVGRAVARGQGNTIDNNGYAGIEVFNFGTYRTGSFIVSPTQLDNDGPFETISVGASGVIAVDIGQMSFVDLRQVLITGNVFVGFKSMLQLRGDGTGDVNCSQLDGNLTVTALQGLARLRQSVHVTGGISGTVDGASVLIETCPNLL